MELAGRPIGRLYVDRREDEIRIIDIALFPEHRGKGIGSRIMETLLDEGKDSGKPVTIHVEKNNPALRLYRRLGFTKVEDQGVYDLMEWRHDADRIS
jgi:ribosomal protein S18 acetylase RimI-like enzyme